MHSMADHPQFVNYLAGASMVDELDHELRDRDELLRQLKHNLQMANNCMKQYVGKGRRECKLKVGNWVYL
jgi:hypothetical protein